MIDGGLVIGAVTSQSLGRRLLVDQRASLLGGGGSIGRAGLDLVGRARHETSIDRSSQSSRAEASGATNTKERHYRRRGGKSRVGIEGKQLAGWNQSDMEELDSKCKSRPIRKWFSGLGRQAIPTSRLPKVLSLLHHQSFPGSSSPRESPYVTF